MPTWKRILTVDDLGSGGIDGTGSSGKVALWQDSDTLTFDTGITYTASEDKITAGKLEATATGSGNGFISGVVGSLGYVQVTASMSPDNTDGGFGIGTRMFEKLTGNSVQAGKVYYYRDGWNLADKDAGDSINLLAVATDAANPGLEMVAEGFVRMATGNNFSGAAAGTPVYIGDSGAVTTSAPTGSGDIARVVGYVINASAKIIYFKPDNTWVTVE